MLSYMQIYFKCDFTMAQMKYVLPKFYLITCILRKISQLVFVSISTQHRMIKCIANDFIVKYFLDFSIFNNAVANVTCKSIFFN